MTVYKCGRLSVLKEPAVFAGLNPFPRILQLLKCPVMSPGIYTGNVRMYACSMSVCLKSWLTDDPGRSISNSPAIRMNSWQSRKTPERLRKTGLTSASRLKSKLWQCLRKSESSALKKAGVYRLFCHGGNGDQCGFPWVCQRQ